MVRVGVHESALELGVAVDGARWEAEGHGDDVDLPILDGIVYGLKLSFHILELFT
jgi:hypothetical protein